MGLRIDPADKAFSHYIRLRDKACTRCFSPVRLNHKGLPISHHASHFWGRGKESTRFDPQNVDCHCHGCHRYFTAYPEEFRAWKLKQLGQKEYDALMIRANTPTKKDRKMQLIIAKELLKSVL